MKTKKEIGQYLDKKIKEKKLLQSDLAERIAKMLGSGYGKKSIKSSVNKWIRGERYPGTEYIYYLAQVLEVSIEEILVAGEVCNKYEDRPFTLYAIAKSGNRDAVDKIMSLYDENDLRSVGQNCDEYGKSLLDYIIQFENLDLLHYLIEKEYVSFNDNQINSRMLIHDQPINYFQPIVDLAVKYDDLEIFSKAIKRIRPILLDQTEGIIKYSEKYQLSKEIVMKVLDTKDILTYLQTPFIPTTEEWEELNMGIHYRNLKNDKELIEAKSFQTISPAFNLLMNFAIEENHPSKQSMIEIAKSHNKRVQEQLNAVYDKDNFEIDGEGNVSIHPRRGSLTRLAGVSSSIYDEKLHQGLLKLGKKDENQKK